MSWPSEFIVYPTALITSGLWWVGLRDAPQVKPILSQVSGFPRSPWVNKRLGSWVSLRFPGLDFITLDYKELGGNASFLKI
jgi:hypothetical protein